MKQIIPYKINKYLKCICFLPFILMPIGEAFSQGQNTTQGKDFWLTFGSNYFDNSTPTSADYTVLQIRIVAAYNTVATLSFTESSTHDTIINLAAGTVYTYEFLAGKKYALYNNTQGTTSKSLRITTDEDVTVFAISLKGYTTDATGVYPVSNLGVDYYHATYESVNGTGGDGYTVIATENGTQIKENGTVVATLNRGQVYSRYYGLNSDETGTYVSCDDEDKPFAFFTTNACVNIPRAAGYCDCLYQQLVPVPAWGNTFLVPVTNRGRDRIRIISSRNGTNVTTVGGTIITGTGGLASLSNIPAGQFVEMEITQAQSGCYIVADRPVAVVSYLMGSSNFTSPPQDERGDPAMAWIPPVEQHVAHTVISPFIAQRSSVLKAHYALIIAPTTFRNMTTVSIGGGPDQALSGGSWTTNAASGYSYYSLPLVNAYQTYEFKNANGLMILGYGLGMDESYYYMAAASARQIDPAFFLNNIHFQDANGQTYCDTAITFTTSIQYPVKQTSDSLKWYIDDVLVSPVPGGNLHNWTMPAGSLLGTHTIKLVVMDTYNNTKTMTTTITVLPIPDPPQPVLPVTICSGTAPSITINNTKPGLTYRIYDAAAGGTQVGSGTGNGSSITINCTGNLTSNATYSVDEYNGTCASNRTTIPITVLARPTVPTPTADPVCSGDYPVIKLNSVNGVLYTVYTTQTGNVSVGSATGDGSLISITLSQTITSGTSYWVEAELNSCISTSRVQVNVSVNPSPVLETSMLSANAICQGQYPVITVNPSTTGVTYNVYDTSTGTVPVGTGNGNGSSLNITLTVQPAAGNHTYYVEAVQGSCKSVRRTVAVTVNSTPTINSTSATHVSCFGASTGSITVNATGAAQYSRDGGTTWQTSNVFNNLAQGTYTIIARSSAGCLSASVQVTVNQPSSALTATYSVTDLTCNVLNGGGSNDGKITVTVSGGTPPYTYIDSTNMVHQSSNVFSGLTIGAYAMLVRDSNGCETVLTTVHISQPVVVDFATSTTHVKCNGGSDGIIAVTSASGGSGTGYQYSKDGGSTWQTTSFTGLSAGNHSITVRDSKGCTNTKTITVNEPAIVDFTYNVTHIDCNGGSNGVITITGASGGSESGYQYSRDGGTTWQTTPFTGLSAGDYTVIARDGNDCRSNSKTITVSEGGVLLSSADVSADDVCPNQQAVVKVTGTINGAVYKVYDALTGGNLVGSATSSSDGSTLNINVGTYSSGTTLYVEVTSGACTSVSRVSVNIDIIEAILSYNDVRVQVCPEPARQLDLNKYIDMSNMQTIEWRSLPDMTVITDGLLSTGSLQHGSTNIFRYSITNPCISAIQRLYMRVLGDTELGLNDTIYVCWEQAEALNLNEILGIETAGTWRYEPVDPLIDNYITHDLLHGSVFFNGKDIYATNLLPVENSMKKIIFYYKSHNSSCFGGKEFKLVIYLTPILIF